MPYQAKPFGEAGPARRSLWRSRVAAYGEDVSFWRPDPGVKFAEAKSAQPGADQPYSRMTVAKKAGHRGEHDISRKAIARGMPGDSGVTVVTSCAFYPLPLHARLRALRAPGIPSALVIFRGREFHSQTRAHRAASIFL